MVPSSQCKLNQQGPASIKRCGLTSSEIAIIKIRRPHDYFIFIIEIPIPQKTVFILRRGPRPGVDCFTTIKPSVIHSWSTLQRTNIHCGMIPKTNIGFGGFLHLPEWRNHFHATVQYTLAISRWDFISLLVYYFRFLRNMYTIMVYCCITFNGTVLNIFIIE